MFTLNESQQARLTAARAQQAEGERRFDFWSRRESVHQATEEFARVLESSGLRAGRSLSEDIRRRLLALASALAPNPNLSRRLYASDPAGFDTRLRTLFYGGTSLEERLRTFLLPRGVGQLTAAQLLCAFAPETYPLLTRPALRRLALTAAQRRDALADAAERYGFDVFPTPDAAQRLLALFIAYEGVGDALGVTFYPDADLLLRADVPSIPLTDSKAVRETKAEYGNAPPALTETILLTGLEEYALGQGFVFPAHFLRAYYISLKTKPFAILSGVSGTGKTKLTELFAAALTGDEPQQFRLIPVRPDWTDATALFGYQNLLANRYVSTPFLDTARAAARPENRRKAFFVCLDEMNLARVEHYLADYLSALESRGHRIPLHAETPDLVLPPNLFVTGTVNIDETAHTFSRKVLDRANTLDFDAIPTLLAAIGGVKGSLMDLPGTPAQRQELFLTSRLPSVGRAAERLSQIDAAFPAEALRVLQSVNDLLYPHHLHFAYRVRDEVLLFIAHAFDPETGEGLLIPDLRENFRLALDLQIVQKVLPKINGLSERLDPILRELRTWVAAETLTRTERKLARMQEIGEATGYVRFYE